MRRAALIGAAWLALSSTAGAGPPPKRWSQPYPDQVERLRARNAETWETLISHGFKPFTKARLRFLYQAPDADQANDLLKHLRTVRGYAAEMKYQSNHWMVIGVTEPMELTKSELDDWTLSMVEDGVRFGCEFVNWTIAGDV